MGQFLDEEPTPPAATGKFLDEPQTAPSPAAPTSSRFVPLNSWGQAYQNVRNLVGRGVDFLNDPTGSFAGARRAAGMPPASEQYNPLPPNLTIGAAQTAVGMMPGGQGLVPAVGRVAAGAGAGAAGAAIEGRDPVTGALIGGGTTAAGELVGAGASRFTRDLPGMPLRIQKDYVSQVGENLETATGGVLRGARTTADLDALVYGAPGPKGLITGRRVLGVFYDQKVTQASDALATARVTRGSTAPTIGGVRDVEVPVLSNQPMSLNAAVDEIKAIGPSYSGKNPALRTQVGQEPRQLRAEAWGQLERYLAQNDPSGQALAALHEARNTFAIGTTFLEAVRDSGALVKTPSGPQFDAAKFQSWVADNRGKFIDTFDRLGTPGAWADLVRVIYRNGPVASQDFATRNGSSMVDALMRLARSGGGTGTAAVALPRTLLPGLGSVYAGQPPYATMPPGVQGAINVNTQGLLGDLLGQAVRVGPAAQEAARP